MSLTAGLAGAASNACAALCTGSEILGICEQERITRVRGAGFNPTGLPDEALDEILRRSGRQRSDITACALAESVPSSQGFTPVRLDHHFAHACAAFLPSPFESATVVVCDDTPPHVSVWDADGIDVVPVEWPWEGPGLAEIHARCAEILGFTGIGRERRMEALARLDSNRRDDRVTRLFSRASDRLSISPDWEARAAELAVGDLEHRAAIASALQSHIGDLLVEFLREVNRRAPARDRLCVSGTLFYNSRFNSIVKQSGVFADAFVPINPGDAGLAVGAAMHVSRHKREPVNPFLGPAYTAEEIKATLDNCKVTYSWASEVDTISLVIDALQKGRLVAWFDGAMEWGPRSLGARSIVANPFAPYVLDNLNRFLKQRDSWRGYALSGLGAAVHEHFDGPARSPFMECDFVPKDRQRFRHILPGSNATVRIQTVNSDGLPRFRELLHAFGEAAGIPMLVNTSFNGFREPMVCSPRDAVRVFFGTGLDTLVLGHFVINK